MNTSKYVTPRKINRDVVSLKTFCSDCKRDEMECDMNVIDCIKEAGLYKEFTKINVD
ncbi:MAG: hypothetical protein ACOCRK_11770 [bacterium]